MVAKISIGSSLYGALAYNAQKVNADEGKLLATNRVFDGGDGQMDCARLLRDFCNCMPENVRTRNTVIHISLNPHPDDRLTDMEMANIAQAYMERLGYGNQPYVIVKHEDIGRHHVHIVSVNVDERVNVSTGTFFSVGANAYARNSRRNFLCIPPNANGMRYVKLPIR